MPKYRTALYGEWKACERFGLLPSGIRPVWEDNNADAQALLLAYDSIRDEEEMERIAASMGAKI